MRAGSALRTSAIVARRLPRCTPPLSEICLSATRETTTVNGARNGRNIITTAAIAHGLVACEAGVAFPLGNHRGGGGG